MIYISIIKTRSAITKAAHWLSTVRCYALAIGNPSLTIGGNCHFQKSVNLLVTDGGSISIGSRCSLSEGVKIVAQGGKVTIADDVFIGVDCLIVCKELIEIGKDSQIAEYVVIRDQDHRTDSRPIRIPAKAWIQHFDLSML